MNKQTIVVNLYGQPSCGKSTGAAYIFSQLKMRGIDTELVTETVKDMVWEHNDDALTNQLYILGLHSQRFWRLRNQVRVIVTDSPILLTEIYNSFEKCGFYPSKSIEKCVNDTAEAFSSLFDSLNFFVKSVKKYNPNGRLQTEVEANNIGVRIESMLIEKNIPYEIIKGNQKGYDKAVQLIVDYIDREGKMDAIKEDRERNGLNVV